MDLACNHAKSQVGSMSYVFLSFLNLMAAIILSTEYKAIQIQFAWYQHIENNATLWQKRHLYIKKSCRVRCWENQIILKQCTEVVKYAGSKYDYLRSLIFTSIPSEDIHGYEQIVLNPQFLFIIPHTTCDWLKARNGLS
jgi:hypothetical protein